MTQRGKSQSIGLLMIVVPSAVLLWALAAMVQIIPVAYADPPSPPQIVTVTVTSSKETYFYDPGLGEEGGTVRFNNLDGEGAGQVITVTVTVTGIMPITLTGAPAFGMTPTPDMNSSGELAVTYTIGSSAGTENGVLFTITASDGLTDTAVITFTQDITDPTIVVTKTADPTSLPEPGGPVTFTVRVDNTSVETVTLTTLTDTVHGDLDGQGTCAVTQTLGVSDFYTCAFTATISSNGDYVVTDTVTAGAEDDVGNTVSQDDDATVTVTDVLPTIVVTKTATPTQVPEPGDTVTFTVRVDNTGVETVTLTTLTDTVHGDLDGQGNCAVTQSIGISDFYTCAFTAIVSGNHGDVVTDTVTAQAQDDENNTASDDDDATVTIIDLTDPVITTITVTSDSPTYFHDPGLIDTGGEVFFNSLAGEGGGQTMTVTVSFTDAHPYSLAGDTAFGDSPGPDSSGPPWTLSYTIETGANSEANRVFTVTDQAGNTDTAVITFTQDNVTPTVAIADVTDPDYDSAGNELDDDGSNWYDPDHLSTGWYFTSTVTDTLSGLALANASWDHSNDTYDQLTYDPGLDGDGVFNNVDDDGDGMVTVTLTISDYVGNPASDTVVFNLDNTGPVISSPSIYDYGSPWLHVDGLTVYYGDDMTSPQSFRVQGQSTDGSGAGLDRAKFSGAFGGTPFDDLTPSTWSGTYHPNNQDWGNGTIIVTVSDQVGNSATQIFTYTRDIISPTIVPTAISETSPYLHAEGLTLYYSDMMSGSAQDFEVQGTASDDTDGAGFRWVTFPIAFGDSLDPDSNSPWSGIYDVDSSDDGDDNIVVTAYDDAGNWSTGVFTYIEDTIPPTVALTDVTDPDYDSVGNELDDDGSNWYDPDHLGAGWYFTSTVTDTLSGLALANASWDHSNDTYDQLTYDPGLDGDGVFNNVDDDGDGVVTVTLTISDYVGNPASDTVVFNLDNTGPIITSPYINEASDYLYADGLTIYYGDDMGSAQTFTVNGHSSDEGGVGLADTVDFSPALWDNPSNSGDREDWSGEYSAASENTTSGQITVIAYDLLNNSATQVFTYTRDTGNPTSAAGSPQYDNGGPIVVTYTNATDSGGSGLQWVRLWYKKESGTWADSGLSSQTDPSGSFNFTPGEGDGTYYFATRAGDNVGNQETAPTGSGDDETLYDTTEPTTPGNFHYLDDATDEGSDGFLPEAGYYDDSVIDLEWDPSTDGGSGLLTYHLGTAPQPTGGSYAEDSSYDVGSGGTYSIYLTAEDNAGNISDDAVTGPVTVDIEGPQVDVTCPTSTTERSFDVDWSATTDPGSGLRSTDPYSVSYKVDSGDWQDWITATSAVAATFGPYSPVTVEYSRTYCFRVRAVDKAGNVQYSSGNDCTETYEPAIRYIFLPIVMRQYPPNWGFELGDFTNWQHGGELAQSVSTAMPHSGNYSALLGNPDYDCWLGVPVGSAWLRRSVTVPSSGSPALSFWYRIYTQDKNSTLSDQLDLFAVYINGSRVFADANRTEEAICPGTPYDLDWQQEVVPLDDYKGQTIEITFYNYNRPDKWYNTYTYVDDVAVQ